MNVIIGVALVVVIIIIIIMSRAPVGKCPECDGKLYFSHVDKTGLTIYVCKKCGKEFI